MADLCAGKCCRSTGTGSATRVDPDVTVKLL